ncbi:MAG TPA: hypothetical protein VK879_17470 [Candidatus Sulfomarinibacteraceae bacterium]|nr:hypothetical protein [Candidatus Sulfomarinibacteraceae bacterium]
MDEERERILQLVESGKITAEEAGALLSALAGESEAEAQPQPVQEARQPLDRPWEIPVFGGVVVAVLGLLGLGRALSQPRRGKRPSLLAQAGAGFTLLIGLAAVAAGLWSRTAPWLHVRIFSQEGENVNISLPLPLFLADWAIDLADAFMDEEAAVQLHSVADFVDALRRGDAAAPFSLEIQEGDGDRVLVQID